MADAVCRRQSPISLGEPKAFDASVEPKQMIKIEGSGHAIRDLIKKKPDLLDRLVATLNAPIGAK